MRGRWTLLIGAVLLVSCDSLDPSVDEPDPDPLPETGIIGPDGGTVTEQGVVVRIPAGAFSADAEVQVAQLPEIMVEGAVSASYRITLPDASRAPVTIGIPLNETPPADAYLGVSGSAWAMSAGSMVDAVALIPATVSADTLWAELPAFQAGQVVGKTTGLTEWYITGLSRWTVYSSRNLFRVAFQAGVTTEQATALAADLETAYDDLKGLGFDLSVCTSWPALAVTDARVKEGANGLHERSWWLDCGWLHFNQSILNDATLRQETAAHEFTHMIMTGYDESPYDPTHLWIHEAAATWFEETRQGSPDISNSNRSHLLDRVFNGMRPSASAAYGYSMAAFFHYLGAGRAVDVFEKMSASADPVEAIRLSIQVPVDAWWPEFLLDYLLNQLPRAWAETALTSSAARVDIQQWTDGLELSTPATAPDLGGSVFYTEKFLIPPPQPDAELVFSILPQADKRLHLFASNSRAITHLGSSSDSLAIGGLVDIQASDARLFAVVSNARAVSPFDGSMPSDLTIRVDLPDQEDAQASVTHTFDISRGDFGSLELDTRLTLTGPLVEFSRRENQYLTITETGWNYVNQQGVQNPVLFGARGVHDAEFELEVALQSVPEETHPWPSGSITIYSPEIAPEDEWIFSVRDGSEASGISHAGADSTYANLQYDLGVNNGLAIEIPIRQRSVVLNSSDNSSQEFWQVVNRIQWHVTYW